MRMQLKNLGFMMNYIDQEILKAHLNYHYLGDYYMVLLMPSLQKYVFDVIWGKRALEYQALY